MTEKGREKERENETESEKDMKNVGERQIVDLKIRYWRKSGLVGEATWC